MHFVYSFLVIFENVFVNIFLFKKKKKRNQRHKITSLEQKKKKNRFTLKL